MLKGKTHKSKESWLPSLLKCQFGDSRQRERRKLHHFTGQRKSLATSGCMNPPFLLVSVVVTLDWIDCG